MPIISTLTTDVIDKSTLDQADYCAAHAPAGRLSRVFRWRIGGAAFFWRWADPSWLLAGSAKYRDNAYWIAGARRNEEASDVLDRALLALRCRRRPPWADLLAGDRQRIAAPCYPLI